MSRRILFVDDETFVLHGLQRSLRSMRKEWDMAFVDSGLEALKVMEQTPFDVVISDMRMPSMDGAQLLDLVRQRFPQTVRMVLSGQSDKDAILRAIRSTHQYLSKPCDIEELKLRVNRALALRDALKDPRLREIVSQVEVIPSLPQLYTAIRNLLESPTAAVDQVSEVIVQDMGMTAKLLQLVNSSFLGIAPSMFSPKQAVSVLGIDNLRSLVFSLNLFFELPATCQAKLSPLWRRGYTTALFAKCIARCQGAEEGIVYDAFTAGLLHLIGHVLLGLAPHYRRQTTNGQAAPESASWESAAAQSGAYLLGLWGLRSAVVEAVAWHEKPSHVHPTTFSPLIAVHAAVFFQDELEGVSDGTMNRPVLDEACFAELGLRDQLPVWKNKCRSVFEKEARLG